VHRLSGSLILGYHGCDRRVAEKLLADPDEPFTISANDYDWLGEGIYFWEANPLRGLEFAKERHARDEIDIPTVIGAAIELGYCLDLMTSTGAQAVVLAFADFRAYCESAKVELPSNRLGPDRLLRKLDCAVVNHLHGIRSKADLPAFDTVRGSFQEGGELYTGSGFSKKSHIQVCVRNLACIKGVFRVSSTQLKPI